MAKKEILKEEKIAPDTSIIIEGVLSQKLKSKEINVNEILIHEAVLAELEHQANLNKAIGFLGLEEIERIKEAAKDITVKFLGQRPRHYEIEHASIGEIDAMIRQLAYDESAVLMTSDAIQAKVARAKGMKVIYIAPEDTSKKKLKLEEFFDDSTMSVHLRENVCPNAKKGMPGNWEFAQLRKKAISHDEIQAISREIIEEAKLRRDGFIEIERAGSTIVQLGSFRIVITKPPFSDGWEITAVRPVKRLNLEDYKLSEKMKKRIAEQAEGILIAGSPGMGKSTFAQALAVHYADMNKIVKTVEAPRDLMLPDKITQYAISHGDSQEIHDILLLSRPDYTFFDEMRNTDDFKLFADMRLAGVGMVGVVHGTNPVDAIQRFIGRIEMGVIPQIIDTVVFIKNGAIEKVLNLLMTVKVPSGMTEADLARPVVVVNDFETGKSLFEIYTYGEQTVVVPVQETGKKTGMQNLACKQIEKEFMHLSHDIEVEALSEHKCIVKVPEQDIARIIGKGGKNIEEIEKKLGVSIDVQELDRKEKKLGQGQALRYEINIKKKAIVFILEAKQANKDVDIYINDNYVVTAKASSMALIKIKKDNPIGQRLLNAVNSKEKIIIYS